MKSKHSILLTLALILMGSATFAQNQFGLRTGVSATTLSELGNLPDNNHFIFSYFAGAFYDIQLSKSVAFQPEINYIRKGRDNETTELNTAASTDFMLHYLQVPLLFQYRDANSFEKSGSFFFVNAGPYAGFALSSQTHPSNSALTPDSNKTDLGFILGVGYQTPICKKNIRFDLRYDMGVASIANQPSDYRTKALSFTVGIAL